MKLEEFDLLTHAIEFHEELNPALWGPDRMILPEVESTLLDIARDFQKFVGITDDDLLDITISGSNAAFTYTPNSDIDLHLVVMVPTDNEQLRQLFDAKKYQYNDQHNFKIRGYDVELYVQDAKQPHHSMGIYSVLRDRWLNEPKQTKANIDDASVEQKYRSYKERIKNVLTTDDMDQAHNLWARIKDMRKTGLAQCGEFSPENLTFKLLRAEGDLEDLRNHIAELRDREFSLEARYE